MERRPDPGGVVGAPPDDRLADASSRRRRSGRDPSGRAGGGRPGPIGLGLAYCTVADRVESSTWTERDSLPRCTVSVMVEPAACWLNSSTSGWLTSTDVPLTAVITSLSLRPALAAGLPLSMAVWPLLAVIHAPWSTLSFLAAARPASSAR